MRRIKARLWKLSMRYIVWSFTHLLPYRMHEVAAPGEDGWLVPEGFIICPEEDRWTLHTLAAAPPDHPTADYTFWVRQERPGRFIATEVESGVSTVGPSAEEALQNYWHGGPYEA